MTALTTTEKNLLRAGGHKATLYLSILRPQTVFTAQVNMASPARGARSIVYDNDSGEGDVLPGMTLWVGTSAGACDVGKVRVRAINTGTNTLTVSENSLVWADDQYLTVKRNWELWPVYPRFDASGNFYKDYDIPYTDENEQLTPVATMGPPRAAFDDGSTTTFLFDNDGAGYAFGGETIISRSWDVVGPGAYSWSTVGSDQVLSISGANRFDDAHWVTLTVTDSNGKTQTTRRPVFCHERTGSNAPITAFTLESLSGDWERGGWSARIRVYTGATASDFPDGTLILLWHEASYGDTSQLIGGNYPHANDILFAGYVRGETVTQDWNTGDVTFEATTIDGLLRRSMMFSVPLKMIYGTQDQWYEFTGPTVAQALHHYWRWHSTLFQIADVFLPVSNTLRVETIEDFAKGDIYSQADNFSRHYGIFAHVCCNKLGQVYVAEDAQMLDGTDRAALTVVSDITAADRREEITILHQPEKRASMVHLSGFVYPRTPLISKAPGDAPEDVGAQVIQVERQILESQPQANALAGRVLAAANNPYPEVRVKFAGHYLGALDLVPQEWWTITLAAGDTPRGIVWTDQRLVCRNVSASYDPAAGSILADAVFESEADGEDGVDGDYPVTPPSDPPAPPTPVTPPTPPLASGRLATFDHSIGHQNQATDGTWQMRNDGADTISDNGGGFDPHWATTQGSTDIEDAILWRVQTGHIYRSVDCGRNWSEVTGMGDPPNDWSDDPAPVWSQCDVVMGTPNNYRAGEWYFLVRWQNGDNDWRGWVLKCTGNGSAWTWQWQALGANFGESGTYTFDFTDGPQGWTSIPGTYLSQVTQGVWYSGTQCTQVGYWQANRVAAGGDWYRVTTLVSPVKVTFTKIAENLRYTAAFNNHEPWTQVYTSDNGTDWTLALEYDPRVEAPFSGYPGYTPTCKVMTGTALAVTDKYVKIAFGVNGAFDGDGYHDLNQLTLTNFSAEYSSAYPIWMDIDTADGAYLYLTTWENGQILLKKFATSDLSFVSSYNLGSATINDITSGVYAAYPRVQEFTPNIVYVHGRLPGIYHLLRSTDGGASFSEVTNSFEDANTIGFFIVGHDGMLWAMENNGDVPRLWKDPDGSGFAPQPIVPLSGNVPPDGLTIVPGTSTVAMSSASAVIRSEDGGQTWADQGYPAASDIRSLLFIA